MRTEPTARPWKYNAGRGDITAPSVPKEQSRTAGGPYGDSTWDYYGGELVAEVRMNADGDLIVRAVNTHDALVEACKAAQATILHLVPTCNNPEALDALVKIGTALRLARGDS